MRWVFMLFLLVTTPALAQQPDIASYVKAITVLQTQRNQAMDNAAAAEVKIMALTEENTALKAEIEKLKNAFERAKAPKSE